MNEKIIVENEENIVLIYALSNEKKYICHCTCGENFEFGQEEYNDIKCPKCGSTYKKYIYDYRLKNENKYNIVLNTYKKLTNNQFVIEKKTFEYNIKKMKNNEKFIIERKSMSNIIVDYDFFRKERLQVEKNGKKISTKTAKQKEITNITLHDPGYKYNTKSGGKTLFNLVNKITDTKSINVIIKTLEEYPEIEVLYSTNGMSPLFSCINLKHINKGAKKPHQILGLTRPIFKYFIDLSEREDYYSWRMSNDLYMAIDISKLYKNKPDIGDVLIKDVINNNLDYEKYIKLLNDEKYNRDRLIRYITNDLNTFQGIDLADEGLRILYDYIKMCKDTKVPYVKYPDSLKKYHDVAVKNYKIQIDKIMKEKFIDKVNDEEYKKLESKDVDGYTIIAPELPEDVKKEGASLHHCVASYISYIADGTSKILFMRNKKTPYMSLITLEVRGERLTQYKGSCNRNPSPKEMEAIKTWAKNKKLRIA